MACGFDEYLINDTDCPRCGAVNDEDGCNYDLDRLEELEYELDAEIERKRKWEEEKEKKLLEELKAKYE